MYTCIVVEKIRLECKRYAFLKKQGLSFWVRFFISQYAIIHWTRNRSGNYSYSYHCFSSFIRKYLGNSLEAPETFVCWNKETFSA